MQRRRFFHGRAIRGSDIKDISWFDPSGQEMSDDAWGGDLKGFLAVRLAGDLIGEVDERGEPIVGETLMMLLNSHHENVPFTLPATKVEHHWERIIDTAEPAAEAAAFQEKDVYTVQARSLVLLRIRLTKEPQEILTAAQAGTLLKDAQRLPIHAGAPTLGAVP